MTPISGIYQIRNLINNHVYIGSSGNIHESMYSNIVTNLTSFCREHGLDASAMCSIIDNKRHSHKGWTVCPQ
jgi:hypothetical protein